MGEADVYSDDYLVRTKVDEENEIERFDVMKQR